MSTKHLFPVTFAKLMMLLSVFTLVACGGGGGGGGSTNPEIQLGHQLAPSSISRQSGIFPPTLPEQAYLHQQDQFIYGNLQGNIEVGRYAFTISLLLSRAGIASNAVNVFIVKDFSCGTSVGGGLALNSILFLDGKLLDILSEAANYQALLNSGKESAPLDQVMSSIVTRHVSRPCLSNDPIAYPLDRLTPDERSAADEMFYEMVGGIFFHEFGHVWGWDALTSLRAQTYDPTLASFFALYPSAREDRADVIAGALTKKSGHQISNAILWLDVAAYLWLFQRGYGVFNYFDKSTTYAISKQIDASHSGVPTRIQFYASGFNSYGK